MNYNSLKRRVEKVIKNNSFGESDNLMKIITEKRNKAFYDGEIEKSYALESLAVGLITVGLLSRSSKKQKPILFSTIGLGSGLLANRYFKENERNRKRNWNKKWNKKHEYDWGRWRKTFFNPDDYKDWKTYQTKRYSVPKYIPKPEPEPKPKQLGKEYKTFVSACSVYGMLWYTILGVDPHATKLEIKRAYRQSSLNGPFKHPDRGGDTVAFQCLVAAKDYGLSL